MSQGEKKEGPESVIPSHLICAVCMYVCASYLSISTCTNHVHTLTYNHHHHHTVHACLMRVSPVRPPPPSGYFPSRSKRPAAALHCTALHISRLPSPSQLAGTNHGARCTKKSDPRQTEPTQIKAPSCWKYSPHILCIYLTYTTTISSVGE